jgi:ubiquinone/menaquinone biosynthesis C-methylase UbiE
MPLDLPARDSIALSIDNGQSEDYHLVRLYYSWYSGWFYRNRLKMVAAALDGIHTENVLDIGTGSGIFLKQLLKHASHVTGIDIHETYGGVYQMLEREGVDTKRIELRQGSILDIPYPDSSFDLVVCISVLEHFADPGPPLAEIKRVLRPNGRFVWGCPAKSPITDVLFGMLGYNSNDIHPGNHRTILKATQAAFTIESIRQFPVPATPMYIVCRARKQQ